MMLMVDSSKGLIKRVGAPDALYALAIGYSLVGEETLYEIYLDYLVGLCNNNNPKGIIDNLPRGALYRMNLYLDNMALASRSTPATTPKGTPTSVTRWYEAAALRGHVASCEALGDHWYYLEGKFQNLAEAEAIRWYSLGIQHANAANSVPPATHVTSSPVHSSPLYCLLQLAALYMNGGGVSEDNHQPELARVSDEKRALQYYTQAMALGDSFSMEMVTRFYTNGGINQKNVAPIDLERVKSIRETFIPAKKKSPKVKRAPWLYVKQ
jgi:TPR repeat protein